jgi:hypothetical protein
MNRDQLRLKLAKAVEGHARTLQDQGGRAGPALLDDLEQVAEEHARQHAERVTARMELREQAVRLPVTLPAAVSERVTADPSLASPSLVAADTAVTASVASPSARTRTRTRGGPK